MEEEDKEGIKSCKINIRLRLTNKRMCCIKGNDSPPIMKVPSS